MNIQELQEASDKQTEKFKTAYNLEGRELALAINTKIMEEFGELSDQLLGYFKLQRHDKLHKYSKEELEKELFDTLFTVIGIAGVADIDMNKVCEERTQIILDRKLRE